MCLVLRHLLDSSLVDLAGGLGPQVAQGSCKPWWLRARLWSQTAASPLPSPWPWAGASASFL